MIKHTTVEASVPIRYTTQLYYEICDTVRIL